MTAHGRTSWSPSAECYPLFQSRNLRHLVCPTKTNRPSGPSVTGIHGPNRRLRSRGPSKNAHVFGGSSNRAPGFQNPLPTPEGAPHRRMTSVHSLVPRHRSTSVAPIDRVRTVSMAPGVTPSGDSGIPRTSENPSAAQPSGRPWRRPSTRPANPSTAHIPTASAQANGAHIPSPSAETPSPMQRQVRI